MRSIAVSAAIHVLTASGAVFGLLALLSAAEGHFERAFAWLGIALFVDGLDGPLARRFRVAEVLPRFSGEDLDHIIDYLNYVVIPAFIVARSDIVAADLRNVFAAAIMFTSLYHFADKHSKTAEGYFVGFPAIWNVIVFYCLVMGTSQVFNALLVSVCIIFTFIPLKWVHPVRVRRFRWLTFLMALAWTAAAISAVIVGFPGGIWERSVFTGVALGLIAIGLTAGVSSAKAESPT